MFTTSSRLEGTVARTGDKVVLVPTNVSSGTMDLELSSDGKTLTKDAGPGTLKSVFKKL